MAKKSKPNKATTNVANEEYKLSPLEKKLLGYCKKHKPVLLYGEDKVSRKDLILNVHKENGGLDQNQEYYKDPQDKEIEFGKSTERTWYPVDLALYDNSEIFIYLTHSYARDKSSFIPLAQEERKTIYEEGFFYSCKGILFLDNLLCNDANKMIYHNLAPHIKDGDTSYKWLVIYTENLDGLSQHFKDQFELISLVGENVVKNDEKIRTKKTPPSKVDNLSKGKGFKIPREKFYNTLNETYTFCKKEETEKGEKWPGTKMAIKAQKILKSRYGEQYDTEFGKSYLENLFSKIKKGKLE